ncbi:glycine cleavage system protein GcvH [Salinifilum aidingensis]
MASEEIRYTQEHEWVRRTDAETVRVGITDYAQQQLGDVVFVQVPDVDEGVEAGGAMGEVESTKSVSDLYAPVGGVVTARNEALQDRPELVNSDPFGQGWLVELRLADVAEWDVLLDAEAYQRLIEQE